MFIPPRLKLARKRRGVPKTKLANESGLTPKQVAEFEKGKKESGEREIAEFACVLDFPISFFHTELSDYPSLDSASFFEKKIDDRHRSRDGLQLRHTCDRAFRVVRS